jgi:hypothetical protein
LKNKNTSQKQIIIQLNQKKEEIQLQNSLSKETGSSLNELNQQFIQNKHENNELLKKMKY